MWYYEKKLQYPVKVSECNPRLARYLVEQYGGADGELAAALRYMNQRYTIPDKVIGLLTDIATEEFSHLEMIATQSLYEICPMILMSRNSKIAAHFMFAKQTFHSLQRISFAYVSGQISL